jgi:hypothetical protein
MSGYRGRRSRRTSAADMLEFCAIMHAGSSLSATPKKAAGLRDRRRSRGRNPCGSSDPAVGLPPMTRRINGRLIRTRAAFRSLLASSRLEVSADDAFSMHSHQHSNPPSTSRSTPVTNDAAWLNRNMVGPTISSTEAIRPIGVSRSKILRCSATSGRRFMGVRV